MQTWAEFSAAVKRGATAGRLAGTVTARQERKTRTGNKMGVVQFSDVSGQYEAVLFSEGLAQYRDLLEPGSSVVITVSAEDRPEGINLRIQTVRVARGSGEPGAEIAAHLPARRRPGRHARRRSSAVKGEGQVSFVVIKEGGQGEVEIALPDRYRSRRTSPRRCGRCRAWSRWSWCDGGCLYSSSAATPSASAAFASRLSSVTMVAPNSAATAR